MLKYITQFSLCFNFKTEMLCLKVLLYLFCKNYKHLLIKMSVLTVDQRFGTYLLTKPTASNPTTTGPSPFGERSNSKKIIVSALLVKLLVYK